MANPEHLAILKKGVEVWNRWREENPDVVVNLSRANLSGANLSGINLNNAILTETDLSNTQLYEAEISNAILIKANLSNSKLYYADFRESDLSHANLYQAGLLNADLGDAILNGSNLNNAILVGAKMSDAKLVSANLVGADLSHADLKIADLSNANLSMAKLHEVNLRVAYLNGSNLNGADLRHALICGTELNGTDFSNAVMGFTILGLTDLSTCEGLDSIKVENSCTIDFQTICDSKNIPHSFLLKIGLSELFINYLPDFYLHEGIRLYPVFLSHSWENKEFARKLYEALIAKGVNVFFDEKKMKPGDDIYKSISKGIDHYDKMILVCSKESLKSWWVDRELDRILRKERSLHKEGGKHTDLLIPITIDDAVYKWDGPKAEEVQRYVIGDFKAWQDEAAFEKALNDLIHALNVDRPDIKPPTYLK